MIAIQALTLTHPAHLPVQPCNRRSHVGGSATVNPKLAAIIKKMVRYNFRARYQSATEVLEALKPLSAALPPNLSNSSRARIKHISNSSSQRILPCRILAIQHIYGLTRIYPKMCRIQHIYGLTQIYPKMCRIQHSYGLTQIYPKMCRIQHSYGLNGYPQDDAEDSTIPKKAQAEE
jgi:hypothetical protein